MRTGKFWWLAAIVAAHKDRQVVSRTRLHHEVMLLQRLGVPTDYLYTLFFGGPYSEGVHWDLRLVRELGLVKETARERPQGEPYHILQATEQADLPDLRPFLPAIRLMEEADGVVLELAATYDAFRGMGSEHAEAMSRLRWKKRSKCGEGREEKALGLLHRLGLLADDASQPPHAASTS